MKMLGEEQKEKTNFLIVCIFVSIEAKWIYMLGRVSGDEGHSLTHVPAGYCCVPVL